jgi:hypothetical protein
VLTRLLTICAYVQGATLEPGNGKTNWAEQLGRTAAAALGAAPVLVSQDPAAIVAGVTGGVLLEPSTVWLFQRLGHAMQGKGQRVLDVASEAAEMSSEELYRRIVEDDKKQVLAAKAIEAAMRTAWEDKIRTLGTSLASGVLTSDETQFSTEQRIMAAIGDIEDAELVLLDLLVAWRYQSGPIRLDIPEYSRSQRSDRRWSVSHRKWYVNVIQNNRPRLTPLLPSLIGTLQGHGLITYESSVGSPGAIVSEAPNPGPYAEPTELGELVWMRFDKAGATVPPAWTAPAASSED